jgi:large subunit ribosomal protein L13
VRTYSTKPSEIERVWFVVDAEDMVLGRVATEVARILRGKHRPMFSPHLDTGDHVIVVNAAKIVLTANKDEQSFHYRHSGYPGSLRKTSYGELLRTKPEEMMRSAVRGTLGRKMLTKLKVYAGPEHPHAAQMPKPLDLPVSARRVQ